MMGMDIFTFLGVLLIYCFFYLFRKKSEPFYVIILHLVNLVLCIYLLHVQDFMRVLVIIQLITLVSFSKLVMSSSAGRTIQLLKLYIVNTILDSVLLFAVYFYYMSTNSMEIIDITVSDDLLYFMAIILLIFYIMFRLGFLVFESGIQKLLENIDYEDYLPFVLLPMITVVLRLSLDFGILFDHLSPEYALVTENLVILLVVINSILTAILGISVKSGVRLASIILANNASFVLLFFLIDRETYSAREVAVYMISYTLPVMGYLFFVMRNNVGSRVNGIVRGSFVEKSFYFFFLISMASMPLTLGFLSKLAVIKLFFLSGFSSAALIVLFSAVIINYGIYNLFLRSVGNNIILLERESRIRYLGLGLLAIIIVFGGIFQIIW